MAFEMSLGQRGDPIETFRHRRGGGGGGTHHCLSSQERIHILPQYLHVGKSVLIYPECARHCSFSEAAAFVGSHF